MKNQNFQLLAKSSLMIPAALMLMGNQSCQKTVVPQRELKKFVELSKIQTQPLYLPGGGVFDFKTVSNQQLQGALFDVGGLMSITPFQSVSSSTSGNSAANGDKFFNVQKISEDGESQTLSKIDQSLFQKYSTNAPDIQFSKEASCFINMPHMKIHGSINSFELVSTTGLSLGYSPVAAMPVGGISADMKFDRAQLDMSMVATHPMTDKVIAAVNLTADQTKTQFSLGLDLGIFRLGPSFYNQTPLAEVTKTALRKSLQGIKDQLIAQEWTTRVLVNHDTHISLRGGTDVGLKVGDILKVYNEMGYWIGEPCGENSQYIGSAGKTSVATIELEAVGDSISIGKVTEQTDEAAVPGAVVKVFKFIETIEAEKAAAAAKK